MLTLSSVYNIPQLKLYWLDYEHLRKDIFVKINTDMAQKIFTATLSISSLSTIQRTLEDADT